MSMDVSSEPDAVESTQQSLASSLLSFEPTQYSIVKHLSPQQLVVPQKKVRKPKDSCVTARPGSNLKPRKDSCLTALRKASSQLRTARKCVIEPWETEKFVPDDVKKAPLIPRVSSKSRSRVKYVPTKETLADWNETRYEHYKSEMQRFHKELASLTARHIQAVTRLEERIARRQAKLESEILDQLEEARGKRMVRYCYCKDTFKNKMKSCSRSVWYCFGKYLRGFNVFCCPPLCRATNGATFWPPPRGYFFFRPPDGTTSRKTDTEEDRIPTDENDDEWVQCHIDKLVARKKTYTKLKKATREACEGSWKISNSHDCGEDMHDVEGFVLETSTGNFIGCCRCPFMGIGKEKFCVLYSHPSGSDMSDHLLGVPSLRDMAAYHRCDVYSYDYSGFGISTGSPGERNQNADIRAIYKRHLIPRPPLLHFWCCWLDGSNDFHGCRLKRIFKITVFTVDDTVSLTEETKEYEGQLFLRRIHLPKPVEQDGIHRHYHSWDIRPGVWIDVFSRPMFVYECCGEPTREFMTQQYGEIDFRNCTNGVLIHGPAPNVLRFYARMEPTNFRDLLPVPRRAVENNQIECGRTLLNHRAPIDASTLKNRTPLHFAAESGRVDMVKLLLLHGAIADSKDNDHATPLHIAALHGRLLVVEMLLKAGALVSSKDKDGETPLHFAAGRNRIECARTLLKHRTSIYAVNRFGCTPLHIAVKKGHVGMVMLLLQHGAIIDSENIDHATPLHAATLHGHHLVMKMLITAGASVTSKSKNGWTPLHSAAEYNHIESARTILKHRAPIDAATESGSTPLHLAARNGHVGMVKLLLQHGATIDSRNNDFCTPLCLAVQKGHDQVVDVFLGAGASISSEDEDGWTLLHFTAQKGHTDMVKLLLQHGAIVDSEDNDHVTPLHIAVLHGHLLVVKLLITAGASVTSKDKDGWTPLHIAAEGNHIESARTLLKHHASIDAVTVIGRTPLHFAAVGGHELMVKLLLDENADPDACDCEEQTPLQLACCKGAINCVTYLLERGANPNTTDNHGSTALHFAAQFNHADVAKILIQYGANVDVRCSFLQSALHIVSFNGNVDIVTLLLRAGANPNSANKYNNTPLQFARIYGNKEVAALLVKYGAR